MRWNLQANMPRANVDTEFDAFLVKLGLRDNRRYASQRWLMLFKKSRGIYPPPKYQVDSNQMLKVLEDNIPHHEDAIIRQAIDVTKGNCGRHKAFFLNLLNYDPLKTRMKEEISTFNRNLANALKGATPATIAKKAGLAECEFMRSLRQNFLHDAVDIIGDPYDQSNRKVLPVRVLAQSLHRASLYEEWEKVSRVILLGPDLADDVSDAEMAKILKGVEDKLYYLCGAGLQRYSTSSEERRKDDKKAVGKFVDFNNLGSETAASLGLPITEVNYREYKKDCMKHGSKQWYKFVCLLYASFLKNTNPLQAMKLRGTLNQAITKTVQESEAVKEQFRECFPPNSTKEEKEIWDGDFQYPISTFFSKLDESLLLLLLLLLLAGRDQAIDVRAKKWE